MILADDQIPALACVPSAIPAAERDLHFALAKDLLNKRAIRQLELANGYEFCFEADSLLELAQFVDNERKCCPFITFDLQIKPDAGSLSLRMTGPAGTREVIQSELALQKSARFALHQEQVQRFRLGHPQNRENRMSLAAMVCFMVEQMGENVSTSLLLRGSV